jgi:hypothetical protein
MALATGPELDFQLLSNGSSSAVEIPAPTNENTQPGSERVVKASSDGAVER